ncbi:acyl-CoA--6-aminopenicillanic acid acyl-transferase [Marnyiella aurantia]|uniref:Acyl-CoA--6-aminopenicillanic acid acyl-transferase n=1 Tax=Marnyiella aurantia TaxID=2758037 RepID=A0A7D7QWZ3_9FLAO|nr:C45 family peptidase [Marnyiella aurantia]MBA5247249.1 acyl-CoA--6-aminopenicillanic acid acyl-transferase [Marnyiella aurantia]QMS97426.1 acyl-CoA--6-aminopenicillanic acid acyl-transferase [Marnyiella aurantia]
MIKPEKKICGSLRAVLLSVLFTSAISCGVQKSARHIPDIGFFPVERPVTTKLNDSTIVSGHNFLTKNPQNIWELYITGNALQLGYNNGALTQGLMQRQEQIFFSKVEDMVPSKRKRRLLSKVLKFYNRNLYRHVRNDFQAEIYGLSEYSGDRYDFIAPKFQRNLYLHGAHDIGHALQDLMLVGCSSLAVWDEKSENGKLLIGRNFDFYAGDDFAKEKMVAFVRPESGIPYMSVTWPGMTGVVSGMNAEGLTVTINAGKSKIPLTAKTPISLVTKEILQFARNIKEAVSIAKKRKVFVSESIMVGSAADRKAILIEMSPTNFGVYEVQNSSQLVCSNHFQSEAYKNDQRNTKHIAESHSQYRFERMEELIGNQPQLNPGKIASILRNTDGLKDIPLGYGNEKALNQLLAHHAVIFSPEERLVWVSSSPYQLGEMVCYDLNKIFNTTAPELSLSTGRRNIARDPFADSRAFRDYELYRIKDRDMDLALHNRRSLPLEFIKQYQTLNPELWSVYYKAGKYYFERKEYTKATVQFEKALTKEITTVPDRKKVERYLEKLKVITK